MKLEVNVAELQGDGFQIGEKLGELARHTISYLDIYRELTQKSDAPYAKKQLEHYDSALVDEINGIAKQLHLSTDEAIKLFSGYGGEFPDLGCTTLIQDGFYARNYDFSPKIYDKILALTKPNKGYASVGFCQHLVGRLDGMNEKGLVIGLHFVNNEPHQEGFLATTIVRMVLDQCATTDEAVELIKALPHGFCYNFSITDKRNQSVVVEALPFKQAVRPADQLICTNQFEAENLSSYNNSYTNSNVRTQHLLRGKSQLHTPEQAYHYFNSKNSPLFFSDYHHFFGTLHTVVYCPTTLQVLVGIGGDYAPTTISFRDWLDGKVEVPRVLVGELEM